MIEQRLATGNVVPFPSPSGEAGHGGIATRQPAQPAQPHARFLDCYGVGKTPRCLAGFETLCRWCRALVAGRNA